MAEFVNTNPHDAYVEDPERQKEETSEASGLYRIPPNATVEATGVLADILDLCPGVERVKSDAGKEFVKDGGRRDEIELLTQGPGPKAFPAEDQEIDGPGASGAPASDGGVASLSVSQLKALAKERGVEVKGKGKDKRGRRKGPVKADYVRALES